MLLIAGEDGTPSIDGLIISSRKIKIHSAGSSSTQWTASYANHEFLETPSESAADLSRGSTFINYAGTAMPKDGIIVWIQQSFATIHQLGAVS